MGMSVTPTEISVIYYYPDGAWIHLNDTASSFQTGNIATKNDSDLPWTGIFYQMWASIKKGDFAPFGSKVSPSTNAKRVCTIGALVQKPVNSSFLKVASL